jgi:16S rRNA (cytosine1402-N4)-methyltransferase
VNATTHIPVLFDETLAALAPGPSDVVLDCTFGRGGHARGLLNVMGPAGRLFALDRDPQAVSSGQQLQLSDQRFAIRHAPFSELRESLAEWAIDKVDVVLFDLGVSSPQLDEAERGFSFMRDGPLDMRMDTTASLTAAELVNHADFGSLSKILHRYADERFARRITNAIIAARPIAGTQELAEIVKMAIPAAARRTGGHPAKRTFQALRIAVNAELDVLAPALEQAIDRLAPGGRGAVLSYHSGEDRIVKQVLREAENATRTPRHLPVDVPSAGTIKLLKRAGTTASEEEQARNPRSASARLRLFEKLPVAA